MLINQQSPLFSEIKEIILESRQRVFKMANSALLETYWEIGKLLLKMNNKEKSVLITENRL